MSGNVEGRYIVLPKIGGKGYYVNKHPDDHDEGANAATKVVMIKAPTGVVTESNLDGEFKTYSVIKAFTEALSRENSTDVSNTSANGTATLRHWNVKITMTSNMGSIELEKAMMLGQNIPEVHVCLLGNINSERVIKEEWKYANSRLIHVQRVDAEMVLEFQVVLREHNYIAFGDDGKKKGNSANKVNFQTNKID